MAIIYSIIVIFSVIIFFRLPLIKSIMSLKRFNYNNYRPRVWMRLIDIKNYSRNNIQSGDLADITDLYRRSLSSRVTVEDYLRIMLKFRNLDDINSENSSKEKILLTIKLKDCHITMKREKLGVYCFSYVEIEKLYKEGILEIDDSIINDNIAIISIVNRPRDKNSETDWTTIHPIPDKHRKYQVLNLQFQDDSEDFSVEDAIKIIEFILYNKKLGRDFYVHCVMGKSRSQAVCRFILDTFPKDYKYKRELDNPLRTPNYHILSTLKLVWRDLYEDFTTSV